MSALRRPRWPKDPPSSEIVGTAASAKNKNGPLNAGHFLM
jgi:hypothetical protein